MKKFKKKKTKNNNEEESNTTGSSPSFGIAPAAFVEEIERERGMMEGRSYGAREIGGESSGVGDVSGVEEDGGRGGMETEREMKRES